MRKLDELIQRLCPDGVEFKNLQNLCGTITTGKLNANAMEENGIFPFFTCDSSPFRINTYAFDEEAILISGNGSQVGHINYYKGKFNAYQRTYVLFDFKEINVKFLLHYLNGYLKEYILKNSKRASIPYITLPMLQNFAVPVPPLEVQDEIVRILDKYSSLKDELTEKLSAELKARKKQYEFYKEELLKFKNREDVKWLKLKEIATSFYRGSGIKRDEVKPDGVPCVRYGEIYTTYNIWFDKCVSHTDENIVSNPKIFENGDLLFAITGESVEDIAKTVAYVGNETCYAGGDIVVMKHNQNAKYLSYALSTSNAIKQKGFGKIKSKVVHSNVPSIQEIIIPIPSLEEQDKLVSILDKFNQLCNDLTQGLPAEIQARQKQYEYYRDKLLIFKENED